MEGKKIKGRKRHIVVDTLGNLLSVAVHAANLHDTSQGGQVAEKTLCAYPSLKLFCGDNGYQGSTVFYIFKKLKSIISISPKVKPPGVSPKRWIVERTFAWLGNSRRLVRDYEKSVESSENMVRISMIRLMLNKIVYF